MLGHREARQMTRATRVPRGGARCFPHLPPGAPRRLRHLSELITVMRGRGPASAQHSAASTVHARAAATTGRRWWWRWRRQPGAGGCVFVFTFLAAREFGLILA
ncbi:hypothetical protein R5R35_007677 [Gryllus longicercus]|uniref:Uncharacterized protein n=1 Tax=Gryllus longicercus TaxID=2509291 RepID=A0AAN9V1V1_9ORTH